MADPTVVGTEPASPALTSEQLDELRLFWEVYEDHYEEVQAGLLESLAGHPELGPLLRRIPPDELEERGRVSRELSRRALLDGEWEPYLVNLRSQGAEYAAGGLSFSAWFAAVGAFRLILLPHLLERFAKDRAGLIRSVNGMNTFIDIAMSAIGDAYLASRQETIRLQQEAIRELSTPVLPVREHLLILPIIGVIDTQRARQLMEGLLQGIRTHRAKVVVMDVTGVAAVDSAVANHLIQTVHAARLLGATVIVTGLSSENAQTLVRIGVDLGALNTVGDLRGGLEEANRILGFRVIQVDDRRSEGTP